MALLLGLVVLFFPDVVLGGRTLSSSATQGGVLGRRPPFAYPERGDSTHPRLLKDGPDYNNYLADPLAPAAGLEPLAEEISGQLRAGRVPVWSGEIGLGRPLLGAWGLTPLRLPVFLSPTPLMWDVYLLARLIVAGLFTYLLGRRLGLRHGGATASAVGFAFTGYSMLFINMPHVDFAMMLPVALVAVDRVVESARPWRITVGAVAVALAMLTNNPRTTVVVAMVAAGFGAYRALVTQRSEGRRQVLHRLGAVTLTLAAGAGLTMWAVVPFLELVGAPGFPGQAAAAIGGNEVGLDHLPFRTLISELMPFFEGPPALSFLGGNTKVNHYLGMATLFLAVMAVVHRPALRSGRWFLLAAALVVMGKLYGVPVLNAVGGLPILQDVRWDKYLPPVAALFLVLLAGMGVDSIRVWRPRAVWLSAGGVVAGLVVLVVANRAVLPILPKSHVAVQVGAVLAVLGAAVGVWLLVRRDRLSHGVGTVLLVGLVAAELLFQTFPVKEDWLPPGMQPLLKRTQLQVIDRPVRHDPFTPPPFIEFLERDPEPFRVFGLDRILAPNTAFAFELDDIRSSLLPLSRLGAYARGFLNPTVGDRFVGAPDGLGGSELGAPRMSNNPMFDLLNVKYVLTEDRDSDLLDERQFTVVHRSAGVRVYRNLRAFPRAFLVHDAVGVDSVEDAVQRMRTAGFDPAMTAVVEGLPQEVRAALAGGGVSRSSVRVVEWDDASIELEVETDAPAVLVVGDMYYPGWKATVDGRPATVRPTDVALRSVAVGEGSHRVTLRYRPHTVLAGGAISATVLLVLLSASMWASIRRRRRARSTPDEGTPDEPRTDEPTPRGHGTEEPTSDEPAP